MPPVNQRNALLAWGAIVGQLLFVGRVVVVGALEGHGYSAARHDVSDLAALTAHHAGPMLVIQGISGVLTAAFAFGAPFLLARRMAALDGWRDLARPTRITGLVYIGGMVAVGALTNTAARGTSQRLLIAIVCGGVVALAVRVLRLEREVSPLTAL